MSADIFASSLDDDELHTALAPAADDSDELMGTERLAMSDSDAEGDAEVEEEAAVPLPESITVEKPAPRQGYQKLLDSESDGDDEPSSLVANKQAKPKPKLFDSDSDEPQSAAKKNNPLPLSADEGTPRKRNNLLDSDSVDDDAVSHRKPASTDKSSASSEEDNEPDDKPSTVKRFRKKSSKQKPSTSTAKLSQLCDSSSEDEDYNAPAEATAVDPEQPTQPTTTIRPPKRASAREADNQMKQIQSESQRMAREASLSVPYHRPRQHTLQTFLNRRRVIKPTDVRPDGQKAAASIKMSGEQLEEYARGLEEREKESQLFYKSESEEEADAAKAEDIGNADEIGASDEHAVGVNAVPDEEPVAKPSDDATGDALPEATPQPPSSNLDSLKARVSAQLSNSSTHSSPSLRGSANTIIDLDTGDVMPALKSGPSELYERFLKHTAKPAARSPAAAVNDSVQILSVTNGLVTMDTVALQSNATHDDEVIQDSKPRSAFFKLKAVLADQLAEKRREEIKRRKRETDDANVKCLDEEDDELEESNEMFESNKIDEEDDEEDDKKDAEAKPHAMIADEADDDEDDSASDSDDSVDEIDLMVASTKTTHKRIVMPNDDDSDNELAKPDESLNADEQSPAKVYPTSEVDAMLNICATPVAIKATAAAATRNHINPDEFLTQNADVTESQLEDLCSGAFVTQKPQTQSANAAIIADCIAAVRRAFESSDEDEMADEEQIRSKKVRKAGRNRVAKLSDDEDDADAAANEGEEIKTTAALEYDSEENEIEPKKKAAEPESDADESEIEADEDDDAALVEYDSEENEVSAVRPTKTERRRRAGAFVENEAELSGESDWGSSDEDEAQLDGMLEEIGDTEKFDDDQLREELARIHMRRMADSDAREVKKITDELLHEEDQLGEQRERQFRWKNMNDTNWAEDELSRRAAAEGADAAALRDSDEENEEAWRKMRHERDMMLKDLDRAKVLTSADVEMAGSPVVGGSVASGAAGEAANPNESRKRKITVVKSATNTPQMGNKETATFLIGKTNEFQGNRNSFLARDEQTLTRLANMVKNDADTAHTGVAKGHGNFVFHTLSPAPVQERGPSAKRKSGAAQDEAGELNENSAKKPRKTAAATASTSKESTDAKSSSTGKTVFKKRLLDSLT